MDLDDSGASWPEGAVDGGVEGDQVILPHCLYHLAADYPIEAACCCWDLPVHMTRGCNLDVLVSGLCSQVNSKGQTPSRHDQMTLSPAIDGWVDGRTMAPHLPETAAANGVNVLSSAAHGVTSSDRCRWQSPPLSADVCNEITASQPKQTQGPEWALREEHL